MNVSPIGKFQASNFCRDYGRLLDSAFYSLRYFSEATRCSSTSWYQGISGSFSSRFTEF
jgi:hypothetical protein